ncbi:acyltransferase family protein [Flavisolibacter ginsenosidimutans]|nr:acyltransferase [Flavisolibacter ginsenosidimutans]
MTYIKPLDGLRAIAVLLVISAHWIDSYNWLYYVQAGRLGVNLFFVLSGFLISTILFQHRDRAAAKKASYKKLMWNFYLRRALRIFPIYYLLIFLMIAFQYPLHLELVRNQIVTALTYTSNFYVYSIGEWPANTGHFWSLAVEEQFYLIWPWLMVYLPRKFTLSCILLFIALSVTCRMFSSNYDLGYLFVFTCFDSLGLGALLAWLCLYRPALLQRLQPIFAAVAVVSSILLLGFPGSALILHQTRLFHSIIGFWLISFIVSNKSKRIFFTSLLSSKPMAAIGKISYGLYLYHIFVGAQTEHLLNKLFGPAKNPATTAHYLTYLLIKFLVLLCVCAVSWKYVEKPLLRLKQYFDYDRRDAKPASVIEPSLQSA